MKDIKSNKKATTFSFLKTQILFCIVIMFITFGYLLIFMIPQLSKKYPPSESELVQSYLTPILGWKRNSYDRQWQDFRGNLPTLLIIMFGWQFLSNQFAALKKPKGSIFLGTCILLYAYRADFLFYSILLLFWFLITKKNYRKKFIVPAAWLFCLGFLYLNEQFNHFRGLSEWFSNYVPLQFLKNRSAPILWTNLVNMSFLKLLSFTIDSYRGDQARQFEKHQEKCDKKGQCYLCRDMSILPEFTFTNFCQYMLFPPTLFTGPPIAYKNFHSFKMIKCSKKPEFIRWLIDLLFFELWQHLFYTVKPHNSQTLIQIEVSGLFSLFFIWFKFLIIWRTARLWSLMMGIDVIDNMGRCMFNNYGFQKFWRMWHKGFNHWLIRYLYIPCGGKNNPLAILIVIAFVSFWHDHTLKIVLWGVILSIFMIPQFFIKDYFRTNHPQLYPQHWFKYICAFICGLYIQVICICNLIGFGYHIGETQTFISVLPKYIKQQIIVQPIVTAAVILMFYVRKIDGKND